MKTKRKVRAAARLDALMSSVYQKKFKVQFSEVEAVQRIIIFWRDYKLKKYGLDAPAATKKATLQQEE